VNLRPILRLLVTGLTSTDCRLLHGARDGAGFMRWLLSLRPERSGRLCCHV
jgi:hypothetical protein